MAPLGGTAMMVALVATLVAPTSAFTVPVAMSPRVRSTRGSAVVMASRPSTRRELVGASLSLGAATAPLAPLLPALADDADAADAAGAGVSASASSVADADGFVTIKSADGLELKSKTIGAPGRGPTPSRGQSVRADYTLALNGFADQVPAGRELYPSPPATHHPPSTCYQPLPPARPRPPARPPARLPTHH